MGSPLADLRRLAENAAAGRWSVDWNQPTTVIVSDGSGRFVTRCRKPGDSDLIVAAVNMLPALLDCADALADLNALPTERSFARADAALAALRETA